MELEKQISNCGFVDIVAHDGEKSIAIEIETGKSNVIYNIQKNLKEDFDEIITIVLDRNKKNKIMADLKLLDIGDDNRIKIMDTEQFS